MYRTILIPLDGSSRAEKVLAHVEKLALALDARLILLHVAEHPAVRVGPEGAAPYHEVARSAEREMATYLAARQGELREKSVAVKVRVEHGPVAERILDAAEREGADLIAMTSHGRTGLARVFYGSVAAAVLHRVDRPLLLIRAA